MARIKNHQENDQTVGNGCVIIVDDDAAVRNSLKFCLELDGFVVRTWADGDELLNDPALSPRDCLVIEQDMPGMKGIDLVAKLRDRKMMAPAILVTTHPSQILQAQAAEAGILVIEKPLVDSALLDGICRTILPSMVQRS